MKLMGRFTWGRWRVGGLRDETDQSLVVTSDDTALVMFRGDLRDARERIFCETPPVSFVFAGVASWAYRTHRRPGGIDGGSLAAPFIRGDTSRNRMAGSCPVDHAGIGISVPLSLSFLRLSLSLYRILPSSIFHHPSVSSSLSFLPPRPDALPPSLPRHGQARLFESPKLLRPKRRPSRRRSLSRRLQRVLPLHPQRDKAPQEDNPSPARNP